MTGFCLREPGKRGVKSGCFLSVWVIFCAVAHGHRYPYPLEVILGVRCFESLACREGTTANYCKQMGYAQNTCYQWVSCDNA
jgi:hypothetical protein